jgi:hypothetical protein
MRENEKDASSTRRFSTDDFDCQPPREAVDELLRPKRTRNFRPPEPPPVKPSRLEEARRFVNTAVFVAMGMAFVFAMLAVASWFLDKRNINQETLLTRPALPTPAATRPTPRPTPRPLVNPTPVPRTQWAPSPVLPAPVQPTVRRAELAIKRAEFVGLPIGWTGTETMPDGSIVPVRYMGRVSDFNQLPSYPNLGDMWSVTNSHNSWVWTTPAGFFTPAWVDP